MTTFTWIKTATGEEFPLTAAAGYSIRRVTGFSIPAGDHLSARSPRQHGATYVDTFYKPRDCSLLLSVVASSAQDYEGRQQELARVFNPLDDGKLRITREDAAQFFLICRVARALVMRRKGPKFAEALLPFVADDPFFLAANETSDSFSTSTGEGLTIPFTIPATIYGGGNIATVIANNAGQVEVFPRITINGLADNPQANNVTTGRSFKVNETVDPGDTLEIDMARRTAEIVTATGSRVNVLGSVTGGFWSLEPGQNTVRFVTDDPVAMTGLIRFTAEHKAHRNLAFTGVFRRVVKYEVMLVGYQLAALGIDAGAEFPGLAFG